MIGRLDARKADVTVESDRTNIFGAIEQLDGGFDGLNNGNVHVSFATYSTEGNFQGLDKIFAHFFGGTDSFAGVDHNSFFQFSSSGKNVGVSDTLPRGTVVKLVGLNNVELNGAVGIVRGFDPEKGRYVIRLNGIGKRAVKSINVQRNNV